MLLHWRSQLRYERRCEQLERIYNENQRASQKTGQRAVRIQQHIDTLNFRETVTRTSTRKVRSSLLHVDACTPRLVLHMAASFYCSRSTHRTEIELPDYLAMATMRRCHEQYQSLKAGVMRAEVNVEPDRVLALSALSSCFRMSCKDDGQRVFETSEQQYGLIDIV